MFQCIHNYLLERVPSIGTWCGYIDTCVRWLLGEQVPVGQDIIYLVQKKFLHVETSADVCSGTLWC